MKSKALLFLAVIIAGAATSCKKEEVQNPGSGSGNGTVCMVSEVNSTSQLSTWKSTLSYNAKNQLTETYHNSTWGISGTRFTYDAQGKVTQSEDYSGANKTAMSRSVFTYDAKGVVSRSNYADFDGTIKLVEILRFEYTNNRITKAKVFEVTDGQETETGYYLYAYDAVGNLITVKGFFSDGNGGQIETYRRTLTHQNKPALWVLTTLMTEDPNFPATNLIASDKTETFDQENNEWVTEDNNTFIYTFDASGKIKTMVTSGNTTSTLTYTCK
ncbi:MAG: hypothetical protein LPK49_06465 [Bacteroidota bacterium]|nr:hypothetical protein [Bacteroidota bacterium]MDX5430669.1 hypothetical protein [Bacteroidota bacterium]